MAGGHVSDAFADIIAEAVVTRDFSSIPSNWFFGLSLELPTDQNGSGLLEPTPAEYFRVQYAMNAANWDSAGVGSRTMVTASDIVFGAALVDWGNVECYTIHDAATNGLYLGYGLLNPYNIIAGITPRLPAGTVSVVLPF